MIEIILLLDAVVFLISTGTLGLCHSICTSEWISTVCLCSYFFVCLWYI